MNNFVTKLRVKNISGCILMHYNIFCKNYIKFSFFKKILILAVLNFLLLFAIALFFAIINYTFSLNDSISSLLSMALGFSSIFTILIFFDIHSNKNLAKNLNLPLVDENDNFAKNLVDSLYISYISYMVFASLCLIRLITSLPLVLRKTKTETLDSKFRTMEQADLYSTFVSYFKLDILYSFSMAVVVTFIASGIILNLFNSLVIAQENLVKAKKIWKSTLIVWAALFTVLTTFSILWSSG